MLEIDTCSLRMKVCKASTVPIRNARFINYTHSLNSLIDYSSIIQNALVYDCNPACSLPQASLYLRFCSWPSVFYCLPAYAARLVSDAGPVYAQQPVWVRAYALRQLVSVHEQACGPPLSDAPSACIQPDGQHNDCLHGEQSSPDHNCKS